MLKLGGLVLCGLVLLTLADIASARSQFRKRASTDSSSEEEPTEEEVFALHDTNGDGEISLTELVSFLEEGDGMTETRLLAMVEKFDEDKNGSLSRAEFSIMVRSSE